ncbi:hypothetical protein XELAEV_18010519mg [Xenopus laevis]|uniref:Uncharacterized protein n=1 Tax=Xenopus laevis TaxID=8355 RepID=A0A974DUD5_XENLA|nr:hypothetical protein XELAEV_18010519mg [Xenopus laevis]
MQLLNSILSSIQPLSSIRPEDYSGIWENIKLSIPDSYSHTSNVNPNIPAFTGPLLTYFLHPSAYFYCNCISLCSSAFHHISWHVVIGSIHQDLWAHLRPQVQ